MKSNEILPELVVDKGVPFNAEKGYKGITGHFYYRIEKMEVGDSFEVEIRYSLAQSIIRAFKLRGWRGSFRSNGYAAGLDDKGKRKFKIRFWRTK
jgi:hypothetical protein